VNPTAIQASHLNRLAVVYVRQSTPLQVEQHPESRHRQYQLGFDNPEWTLPEF
jgi:hypothetical protein